MGRVWFITGASRGFGRKFASAALQRGDQVAPTARHVDTLGDLVETYGDAVHPIELDVTDRAAVGAALVEAQTAFGRIDIVVNNAGYGFNGAVEETTEQQLRDQLETNFFGVAHVTQQVVPIMRAQGSGHIIQMSSVGGVLAFAGFGAYNASKWAVEGFSEALAQEVGRFGIRVTLVEPGAFSTDFGGSSAAYAHPLPQYDDMRAEQEEQGTNTVSAGLDGVGAALLQIVDDENPPLRAFLGRLGVDYVPHVYAQRLGQWDAWAQVARDAETSAVPA